MSDLIRSLLGATFVTAAFAAALWLFLCALGGPNAWPTPESPPKQGESLDPSRLAAGEAVHSEASLRRIVREPQNAWSNLAYVFVATVIAWNSRRRILWGLAVAMIGVGLGSFLYHASASRTLRAVDVGAMYWLYIHLALLAIAGESRSVAAWCERWAIELTSISLLLSVAVTWLREIPVWGAKPFNITLVTAELAVVIAVSLMTHAYNQRRRNAWLWPAACGVLFGVAAALQVGDRPFGWCCNPNAVVQGHALWHLLSAAAGGVTVWRLAQAAWPQTVSIGSRLTSL